MHNRWLIVLASALALSGGQGAINVFAGGLFIGPLTQDLGVGRGVLSSAIGMSSMMTALASPFVGRLADRYGARATLLVSIVAFALATAALSQLQTALLFPLFALSGLCGAGQTATPYAKVVVGWFDRERGLAIGVTLIGVGLGTVLAPPLAAYLIGQFGWRSAYAGMGVAIFLVAFVPTALFIREREATARGRANPDLPGIAFADAVSHSRQYWLLVAAFFLSSLGINGILIHVVPLLTDRGMSVQAATGIVSASGLAAIVSRLICGYLIDRMFAPFVGIAFLVIPIAGVAVFASGLGGCAPLLAGICVGAGLGAEVDLMSFLIGRYFGLRAFGSLHGLMFSAFLLGQAGGASGWSQELLGSYTPGFAVLEIAFVIACALFAFLGPYRYPPGHDEPAAASAALREAA